MKVSVTTTPDKPAVPSSGGLIFVTDVFDKDQPAIYAPGPNIVTYLNHQGWDYYSSVQYKARGPRAGETVMLSA